jgi:diguanylate cyclase (GGDEF)-like protein/PAS domain S-box-containing protein
MVTKSDFGERHSKVMFDRVELDRPALGHRAFELSGGMDLADKDLRSVTWVYDPKTDSVVWSNSLAEFFGFEDGARGFSVRHKAEIVSAAMPVDSGSVPFGPNIRYPSVDDACVALLAPILAPLRHGHPAATFDLSLVVNCPDGADHQVVVRAGPIEEPAGADSTGPPNQTRCLYVGVVIDVTAQETYEREIGEMVDRYRLLTEVSPDAVFVHQNGQLVYWNRAGTRLTGLGSSDEAQDEAYARYYGHPITSFLHPADIEQVAERMAQLTEPGQFIEHGEIRIVSPDGAINVMEVTSVRTTWGGEPAFQVIARDISERKAAEASARYRASLVAHVSDAIIGIDADGRIESWNEAAQHIYGWNEAEVAGLSIGAVVSANRTDSAAILERGQHSHHRKDGSSVDVLISIDPLMDDDTLPSGWVVVCTELTDARQAEAGRRAAEERYEAVVASLSEGIILFDEAGEMSASNQAAATILGSRLDEGDGHRLFTGPSIATSTEGFPLTPTMFPHVKTLTTGESEDGVIIGVTDEHGKRQWLSMSSRLLSGASQIDSPMVVCSFTDVTDRRAAEAQLHWLAYHDSLTGLGNRSYFNDELERELLMSMQSDTNLAVLFIDLDRFKLVNDSFGHASGDELLLELARRFKTAARKSDVVSRFSGDEFVVLCPIVRTEDHAVELAEMYSRVIDSPFILSTGRSVVVTCSVGVAFVEKGRQSAQDILQQADTAMFKAKGKGRSRIEVFDESLRVNSVARLEIYDDLRHSIEHDELVVHYQPIASVADGNIVALEALVRWNHPTRGLLGPMEFIPFAEETDLIFSLGRWVLREACAPQAGWRNEVPGAEDAYITVNLSVHQLSDKSLLHSIAEALADSGLPPEALVLEVTESLLMSETQETVDALSGIHAMGVGLAIDDFGTGESSLARLKRFPVKVLKIDKSFVDGLGILETDEAIVAAIVQLSKALGLVVLAEGVETPVQLERVAALGCDLYQGYLMSRPISADHVDFTKKAETTPQTDLSA